MRSTKIRPSACQRILARARAWVGREFESGKVEQCANFVRQVFQEAEVGVGLARRPSDWKWTHNLPQGPEFANSFFSDDVGRSIALNSLEPGDLLAFRNTYTGDFPPESITHVGIFSGEGRMIDRSTASEPVREMNLSPWWTERLIEARRPYSYLGARVLQLQPTPVGFEGRFGELAEELKTHPLTVLVLLGAEEELPGLQADWYQHLSREGVRLAPLTVRVAQVAELSLGRWLAAFLENGVVPLITASEVELVRLCRQALGLD